MGERRRGWTQFVVGIVAYTVLVAFGAFLFAPAQPLPMRLLMALLPLAAAFWAMSGWLAAIRSYDELQRRIFSEAGLFALAVTALLTFSYGFLEVYVGAPRLSMFAVWPLIGLSYGLGVLLSTRRYA